MPLIDMPLEKLREYNGISPKPSDFDEYWDRALKEMEEVEPNVSFEEGSYKSKNYICRDMFFTGVRGAKIHCKCVKPKVFEGKLPAVLYFHGYSGKSPEFTEMLSIASEGYAVYGLDCRGQGGESEDVGGVKGTTFNGHIIRGLSDHPDNLLFRDIFLDTALLAKIVYNFEETDKEKIYTIGGSQGGALSTVCASLSPYVTKAAITFPFLADYRRVWEMDMAERAYSELKTYFRFYDPTHEHEDEIFYKLGYIDIQFLAPRIKAQVLFFTGLMDNVCPPSTQFSVYNKITSKKDMVIYPDFGHEGLPLSQEKILTIFNK